jgi:hypothetical protein
MVIGGRCTQLLVVPLGASRIGAAEA